MCVKDGIAFNNLVTDYHDLMLDYVGKYQIQLFIQTRRIL